MAARATPEHWGGQAKKASKLRQVRLHSAAQPFMAAPSRQAHAVRVTLPAPCVQALAQRS
jgi:hypothetical protein